MPGASSRDSRTRKGTDLVQRLATVLAIGLGVSALAFQPDTHPHRTIFDCAENLQLPRIGAEGAPGETVGPLLVKIIPDKLGRPASITIQGGEPPALMRSWLESSTFARECADKELALKLTFITEGPPQDYPFSWVTFSRPDHFTIHSRARKPTVFKLPGR